MSQELEDEKTSINSIYGEHTLVQITAEPSVYGLIFPCQPAVSLRVEFPLAYPDVPPSILGTQSVGIDVAKGEGALFLELVRNVLSEVYTPGTPCIFDLLEEVDSRSQQLDVGQNTKNEDQQVAEADGQRQTFDVDDQFPSNSGQQVDTSGEQPPWSLSEIITEKKSVFVARSAPVISVEQAKQYLAHLLASDKKVAKATHSKLTQARRSTKVTR